MHGSELAYIDFGNFAGQTCAYFSNFCLEDLDRAAGNTLVASYQRNEEGLIQLDCKHVAFANIYVEAPQYYSKWPNEIYRVIPTGFDFAELTMWNCLTPSGRSIPNKEKYYTWIDAYIDQVWLANLIIWTTNENRILQLGLDERINLPRFTSLWGRQNLLISQPSPHFIRITD